jgi:hypothetical protein
VNGTVGSEQPERSELDATGSTADVFYEGACMLRRLCVALTLGILMLAALAQGAAADPINAKNSLTFPADCGGQTVQFTVNGGGDFTPGHVVGSTSVFVLQSFSITFEFTPTGGETMSETAARSRGTSMGTW